MSESRPSTFVQRFGERIAQRDGGWFCTYCGRELHAGRDYLNMPDMACVDHIIPQSAGGTNDIDNLVLSCRSCNSKKGRRLVYPYRILQPEWKWIAARFVGTAR